MMKDRRRSFDHDGRHEDRRNPDSHGPKEDSRRSSYNYDRRHDTNRSGSYRDLSRFEDDQPPSITTDKHPPLPSTTKAKMHQAGLANSPPYREPDIRSLIDIFCDKVWWLVQCEQERKKEKKLLADRERCPPGNPETIHYSDILRLQIEQCQKAKKKCSDRMNMADDKFMAGIAHLMERYAPRNQTPPAPGDSAVQKEDIDATLESFRGTLHASVNQRINQRIEEEVEKLSASTHSQLQRETEELKKSLESERQRNDRLEKRLEDMEEKFKSLSQRQDIFARENAFDQASKDMAEAAEAAEASIKLKQVFATLDRVSVNAVTKGDLSTALEKFDNAVATPLNSANTDVSSTPGSKTALRLQQLSSALDDIKFGLGRDAGSAAPPCILHLQNQASSGAELIQDQSKKSATMSETIKTIRGSISTLQSAKHGAQVPLPAPAPAPPQTTSHVISQEDLDIKITRVSTNLLEDIKGMMQEKLATVAKELGSFIDNERREREKSSIKAQESCAQVESLRQGVDELRTYTHTSVHRLDKMDRHHLMQLQLHRDAMASFDSRLQLLAMEHAGSAEEVALQLRVLNKWQSNFTTKPMYREIVDHITKTLPTGTIRQLSALSSRIDAVESQMRTSSDGTLKKRKTQG